MSKVHEATSVSTFKELLESGTAKYGDFIHVELSKELVDYLFSLREGNPREYKHVHATGYAGKWSQTSNAGMDIFGAEHFNAVIAIVDTDEGEKWSLLRGQHTIGALVQCNEIVYAGKRVIVSIGDSHSGLRETNTRNQSKTDKARVLSEHLKSDVRQVRAVANAIHGIATAFTDRTSGKRINGNEFIEQVSWFMNEYPELYAAFGPDGGVSAGRSTWVSKDLEEGSERRVLPAFAASLALLWHFHDGTDVKEAYDEIMGYNLAPNCYDRNKGQYRLLWRALNEIFRSVKGIETKRTAYRGEGHLRYAFKCLIACTDHKCGMQQSVEKIGCLTEAKDGSGNYSWVGGKSITSQWNTTYPPSDRCVSFVKELTETYLI